MGRDFFPKREDLIPPWALNLSRALLADGEAYGVSPEEAAHFDSLRISFVERYGEWAVSLTSGIRSRPLTIGKSEAKAALEADARRLSRRIHGVAGMDSSKLIALGLSARTGGGRNPKHKPRTAAPNVHIKSVQNRTVTVQISDLEWMRRGRPPGTCGAAVFIYCGEKKNPPALLSDWAFATYTTETEVNVEFPDHVPPGRTVWIMAHWLTPRLEPSPMSFPRETNLQGGGVSNAGKGLGA